MTAGPAMYEVDALTARYDPLVAIRGVSLSFGKGERIGIFGHNGSGKSTLMKCCVGAIADVTGTIRFFGAPITPREVHRNVNLGIGWVPQSGNVFPNLTVAQCLRTAALGGRQGSRDEVFGLFPLLRERLAQRAGSLSGGEQQMLAVGMSLMRRPEVMLLDEPTAGLAPVAAERMLDALNRINQELATAIIIVEQNVLLALDHVDRAIVLRSGEVVYDGASRELKRKEDLWNWF